MPLHQERRRLSDAEFEHVSRSHHPAVAALDKEALVGLARQLRAYRDKVRDVHRTRRRAQRGGVEARGAAPAVVAEAGDPGTPLKKQIFSAALKRVNRHIARHQAAERKARSVSLLRGALSRRRGAAVHHPDPGQTASAGMQANESDRRTVQTDPREIGRVSQFVKDAQAQRDSRG
ncbi:hypothetical protein M0638_13010 [Roseomonas sp. NAR14]|uniref:Uncharacterized protein n=1 Tax=Roseomonas acroporae TaxID=2937791 RepID=A0A9X1Y911_9PROT|nr:hypothetical protein [Roseomonas acroporae]